MWWIFISIVFALILYVSTRNLAKYSYKDKNYILVKFPIWKILLVTSFLLTPGLNIITFFICICVIFITISIGTEDAYSGWQLLRGKKNWVYSVIMFLKKEI